MNYKTENNVIYVNRLKLEDLLSLLATIHHITNGKGFSYFTLDFTNCSMIHPAAALALLTAVAALVLAVSAVNFAVSAVDLAVFATD